MATVIELAKKERELRESLREAHREAAEQRIKEENAKQDDKETDKLLADIANNGGLHVRPFNAHIGPPAISPMRPAVVFMHPETWEMLAKKAEENGYECENRFIWLPPSDK